MVKCLLCNVENRDGRCGHDEKYCYRCCTGDNAEHHDVLTCHFHFSLLPALLQDARLLTGNVQPDVVDFHAERLRYQENARLAVAAAAVHLPPGGANHEQPPSSGPSSPHPVPPHPPQPPAAADVTAVLASLTTALAAVTARLDRIDTGHASTAPASIEVPPPRHRQAVLQPSSSPAALANLFSALDVSDDDDNEQEHKTEVSTQRIVPIPTLTSIFPATLVTVPAGSLEDSQQQLAHHLQQNKQRHQVRDPGRVRRGHRRLVLSRLQGQVVTAAAEVHLQLQELCHRYHWQTSESGPCNQIPHSVF